MNPPSDSKWQPEYPRIFSTLDNQNANINRIFSYYRDLHPDQFSDSTYHFESVLTPELFDFQISRLSTDQKQDLFETFCRRLIIKLLTPNLRPQTGPTGGGDGKVDAETYEVSEDTCSKWFVASGNKPDELWAIAISCKNDWKAKIKSDVKKILETQRGYTHVKFFTNQPVSSKQRFDCEISLRNEFGIDVKIFDASWLRQSVFDNDNIDIAVEELNLSEQYKKMVLRQGPKDLERAEQLKEIENTILTYGHIEGIDCEYVELLREASRLSRELERPGEETRGRYRRAISECKKYGTNPQLYQLTYDFAWAAFFWLNDIDLTLELFQELKELIDKCINPHRVELLCNINTLICNANLAGLVPDSKIVESREYMIALRNKVGKLDLKSCALFLDMYQKHQEVLNILLDHYSSSEDDIPDNLVRNPLVELGNMIKESRNHIDLSFEQQIDMINVICKHIGYSEPFETLLDELSILLEERNQDINAANLHFERAEKLFKLGKPKDAIKHLGFCILKYAKENYTKEFILSNTMMGYALNDCGFPLSAESFLIKAVGMQIKDFFKFGQIKDGLLLNLLKLCEIELRLGRLVMFLNWYELLNTIIGTSAHETSEEFQERNNVIDIGWCCLLLKAFDNHEELEILPDILNRNYLYTSAEMLKYILGYKEEVTPKLLEGVFSHIDWKEKLSAFPINDQFYSDLIISKDGLTSIDIKLTSCNISVEYPNSIFYQMIAQQMIAAIELIIATMEDDTFVTLDGGIFIEIRNIENGTSNVRASEDSNSLIIIEVNSKQYSADIAWKCIAEVIGIFMGKCSLWRQDTRDILSEKQAKENLMDRLSSLLLEQPNIYEILGVDFKYTINQWQKGDDKFYKSKSHNLSSEKNNIGSSHQKNNGSPKRLHVSSSNEWWEKAIWVGVGFCSFENQPPILTLAFEHLDYGEKIFKEWKQLYDNESLKIKIYFITGFDKYNPMWYRVSIVPDISLLRQDEGSLEKTYSFSRSSTMTAVTLDNLYRFRYEFIKYGGCRLMPSDRTISKIDDYKYLAIPFSNIEFREAWSIGLNEQAIVGLRPGDNPVIPSNHADDAPILEVLKWFQK